MHCKLLLSDIDFLFASLNRSSIKVVRTTMDIEITIETGIVRSFSENYIRINDGYFLRNKNKFIFE
jgi:hypothetical protein